MTTYCTAEFVTDTPGRPGLACDKPSRFHLVHRDPATGIRYFRSWRGIFCLCAIFRHRPDCPLRSR